MMQTNSEKGCNSKTSIDLQNLITVKGLRRFALSWHYPKKPPNLTHNHQFT